MRSERIPKLTHHKASNQGVVRLNGVDHYCGPFGAPATKREYDRLISEWLARGRRLEEKSSPGGDGVSVGELILRFMDHAKGYYVDPDGIPTSELTDFKYSLRQLRRLYETLPVSQFGPLKFRAVMDEMIRDGLSRRVINSRAGRVRRLFKWGVSRELVPEPVYRALLAVPGLQKGRCGDVPEHPPVEPVPMDDLKATLPHLGRIVRAMVETQLLLGCRPQDVCRLTPGQIDRTRDPWLYRPRRHKTAWRGRERVIPIGPRAKELLVPFLDGRADDAPCFSPFEAMEDFLTARRTKRKSKRQPSQAARKRKRKLQRSPGDGYDTCSYGRAIARACRRAKVAPWSPNRLRHLRAVQVRELFGIEAASSILGHADLLTSTIYASKNQALAEKIANEIG